MINHELDSLNERAGAELLKHLGVHGRETELMAAVREVGGHALSVSLLGTYLSAVCAGDVARRDTLRFHDLVDAQGDTPHDRQARRANRIMDAYVERFEQLSARQAAGEGDPERLILSLVGLFDRPAEADALAAVLAAPAIPGLTDGWHALTEMQQKLRWDFALKRLRALKLIASPSPRTSRGEGWGEGQPQTAPPASAVHPREEGADGLDAHPVVRQHFGRRLKEDAPDAYREANRRLYEHYKALPQKLYGKDLPDTLEEMQPLFFAIAHGCAAGLHQEVFDEVYWQRVLRQNTYFAWHKLGAINAWLATQAHFFTQTWNRPSTALTEADQAIALNNSGLALRALGRLREAVYPFRGTLDMRVKQGAWSHAAASASNLSELLLTLGDVAPAVAVARDGVAYADESGDAFRRTASRTTLADALHQAGDTRGAAALFAEGERLQEEMQPELPRLYSLRGYQFCEMLLGQGRHAEVEERYRYLVSVRLPGDTLLDFAFEELVGGGAAHQAWAARISQGESIATARRLLDAAVEGLRRAGSEDNTPRGLLARAAFRRDTGDFSGAQEDLDETHEIADRGGMRLFLTDYHLERARLLLAQIPGVNPPDEWTLAIARAAADAPSAAPVETPKGWLARIRRLGQAERRPNARPVSPAGVGSSLPLDPTYTLTPAHRALVREADKAWEEANALVQATGYHRRDGELAALRTTIDGLLAA